MTTGLPLCPTTIAHWAPAPVNHLERVLKVPRNPPTIMGQHTPLPDCVCLDHACRGRLMGARRLLVGLGVYHFPVFYPTLLHLLIEGDTVEAHIRARRLLYGAVMEVVARD